MSYNRHNNDDYASPTSYGQGQGFGRRDNDEHSHQGRRNHNNYDDEDQQRGGYGQNEERRGGNGGYGGNNNNDDNERRGGHGRGGNNDDEERRGGNGGYGGRNEERSSGYGNNDREERSSGYGNSNNDNNSSSGYGNNNRDEERSSGYGNSNNNSSNYGGNNRDGDNQGAQFRDTFGGRDAPTHSSNQDGEYGSLGSARGRNDSTTLGSTFSSSRLGPDGQQVDWNEVGQNAGRVGREVAEVQVDTFARAYRKADTISEEEERQREEEARERAKKYETGTTSSENEFSKRLSGEKSEIAKGFDVVKTAITGGKDIDLLGKAKGLFNKN